MFITVFLGIIYGIAEMIAKDLEATMTLAFDKQALKGGMPIITYRKKSKIGIIVLEVYSTIPLKVWTESKGTLSDLMNCQFLTDFERSEKSNRIVMKFVKRGKKRIDISDENF